MSTEVPTSCTIIKNLTRIANDLRCDVDKLQKVVAELHRAELREKKEICDEPCGEQRVVPDITGNDDIIMDRRINAHMKHGSGTYLMPSPTSGVIHGVSDTGEIKGHETDV